MISISSNRCGISSACMELLYTADNRPDHPTALSRAYAMEAWYPSPVTSGWYSSKNGTFIKKSVATGPSKQPIHNVLTMSTFLL